MPDATAPRADATVYEIAAFYKFVGVDDAEALVARLQETGETLGAIGSVLVAPEGINGTIAAAPTALRAFLEQLRADPRFVDLAWKTSYAAEPPFRRFKAKLKREIVSMGAIDIVRPETVGAYVRPADWNAVVASPDVVLVDVRNDYEVAIGTFPGAIDPQTASFRDFPAWAAGDARMQAAKAEGKAVAMFCTGGIRCEKATAHLRAQGFETVLHLEGGILAYLEASPPEASLWRGECFVFDDRVSVDGRLAPGSYDLCHGCRRPITAADKASPLYAPGVACPACAGAASDRQRERREERARQIRLAAARGERHLGRR